MTDTEPTTQKNLFTIKNTYRLIADFFLTQATSGTLISERFRDLSVMYGKTSQRAGVFLDTDEFKNVRCYNFVYHDFEVAYYTIVGLDYDSVLLPVIRNAFDVIDKMPVKN